MKQAPVIQILLAAVFSRRTTIAPNEKTTKFCFSAKQPYVFATLSGKTCVDSTDDEHPIPAKHLYLVQFIRPLYLGSPPFLSGFARID
jgi:hypothetical protein